MRLTRSARGTNRLGFGKMPEAEVRMAVQESLGMTDFEAVMHPFEYLRREGELRGELRGELKGELKGVRKILKQQLTVRFGALSPEVLVRIDAANDELLEKMSLRVLTAASLEEVLDTSTNT